MQPIGTPDALVAFTVTVYAVELVRSFVGLKVSVRVVEL